MFAVLLAAFAHIEGGGIEVRVPGPTRDWDDDEVTAEGPSVEPSVIMVILNSDGGIL